MNPERIRELLGRFDSARVLVVGDIYLDENVYGRMTGISLEAPIPIFEVHERRYNPGAAGNAACNVAALGARTWMVGVVGADTNAEIVRREFMARNVDVSHLAVDPSRPTNTYGKWRAGGYNIPEQEVLRTDTPAPLPIAGEIEDRVVNAIQRLAEQVDAIVVTDQVGSVATERVLATVAQCAAKRNLVTVGDSRARIGSFRGFTAVTPNDAEACVGLGLQPGADGALDKAAAALLKTCRAALITRGPLGITVYTPDAPPLASPSLADRVVDVTGAGDTVTAAVAVSLVAGATPVEAARLGNAAAAVAVAHKGVVTVSRVELEEALLRGDRPYKLKSLDALAPIVQKLQADGKKVVWTNGCFDILHVGHITYLGKAAREGDVLVVGLNSDASVKAVKGPGRPIVPEAERAVVLSSLECVDYVTIFSDPSPARILQLLKPDVYTKGGDYTLDTINQEERSIVEGYGGRIAIVPGVEGRSTSSIVERISRANG